MACFEEAPTEVKVHVSGFYVIYSDLEEGEPFLQLQQHGCVPLRRALGLKQIGTVTEIAHTRTHTPKCQHLDITQ